MKSTPAEPSKQVQPISPELAEVLHMLKALETLPVPTDSSTR